MTQYKKRLNNKLVKTIARILYVYDNIITSIHEIVKEVLGIKKKQTSGKIWWDEETEAAVSEKKKHYQKVV